MHPGRLALVALTACLGCATTHPVVYPSGPAHGSAETAARDREACEAMANDAVKDGTAGRVAGDAARSGAIGAGAGAAGGAVWGAIRGGVASGAAGGAAGGAVSGIVASLLGRIFDPPPPSAAYRAVTERCLRDRGYDVVAWQ